MSCQVYIFLHFPLNTQIYKLDWNSEKIFAVNKSLINRKLGFDIILIFIRIKKSKL